MHLSAAILPRLRAALSTRYFVERELARGGMATVFVAQDLRHARRVALKVLHPELSTTLGTERFLREIATTGQLVHPHILALFDSGEADGLLYYVMPFLEGESLRQRLQREGPLPLEDALRIARESADALHHAHERGIVHRDIKPENILLTAGGHACVADFGLARAIHSATNQRLTSSGLTVGSPHYISPEQASGAEVDGRADLYSLGCVLYEMLAGRPPFESESTPALLTQHLVEPPPPVRQLRPSVPEPIAAAVHRALAKRPAERFADAAALARALRTEPEPRRRLRTPSSLRIHRPRLPGTRRRQRVAAGAGAALLVLLAVLAARGLLPDAIGTAGGAPADSSLFVVLPVRANGDVATALEVERTLNDALGRWQDIRIVDPSLLAEALAREGGDDPTVRQAQRTARALGAGRLLRAEVARSGGGWRLHAALYPTSGALRPLAQGSVRLEGVLAPGDPRVTALADSLLFHGAPLGADERPVGTTSARARLLYWQAGEPLREWQVTTADSLLSAAVALDPQYARALLWLAQWRLWAQDDTTAARGLAERAVAAAPGRLAPREQRHATALAGMLRGDFPESCAGYDALFTEDTRDFPAAYNLGECLRRDRLVVPDVSSPSGWSFRSSYHRAVGAYVRAYLVAPASYRGFGAESFAAVRARLYTNPRVLRSGTDAEGRVFLAFPGLAADTLAFVPRSEQRFRERAAQPTIAADALARQRRIFRSVAAAWVSAYPEDADALEALATAQELEGDTEALSTVRRARAVASTPESRLRLATAEVWLRLKAAFPDATDALPGVRVLADSILRATTPRSPGEARQLAALAGLTGQAHLAARLTRSGAGAISLPVRVELSTARDAEALLAYAALGGPADSIDAYAQRVAAGIGSFVAPQDQAVARYILLGRPASILGPDYARVGALDDAGAARLPLLHAYRLQREGETQQALAALREITAGWRAASAVHFESLLPAAWLLHGMGEDGEAVELLTRSMALVAWLPPGQLSSLAEVGPLVLCIALLAELESRQSDHVAADRWARAGLALWREADPSHPAVQRMQRILAGTP